MHQSDKVLLGMGTRRLAQLFRQHVPQTMEPYEFG
jgi:hypothetical protein